jgi:O-antigen/teichoic acid export membrane protein
VAEAGNVEGLPTFGSQVDDGPHVAIAAERFRFARLRLAVLTSLGSKATTLGIQFLAMPVAVRALGQKQFALYAVLVAAVGWLGFANFGVGPGVAVGIARAAVVGDLEGQRKIFGSAVVAVSCLLAIIALAAAVAFWWGAPERGLGSVAVGAASEARGGLEILVVVALFQALFSVFEAVQIGLQGQHVLNLWLVAGNLTALAALLFVAVLRPTVIGMILALNVPVLLARLANTVGIAVRHANLWRGFRAFRAGEARSLVSGGLAYSLVGVGAFINHQFPVILVGRVLSASSTATLAAAMSLFLLAFGAISLVGAPLWPAVADGAARGEVAWVRRTLRHARILTMSTSFGIGVAFGLLGPWGLRAWCGSAVEPTRFLMVALGLYFMLAAWEYIHYVFLLGFGMSWLPALVYLARSALGLLGSWVMVNLGTEAGPVLALCASVAVATSWAFPWILKRSLNVKCAAMVVPKGPNETRYN